MGWQAKHLYSVLVVGFLLYLGIGVIFYPPILSRYWVPVLVSLYLLAYLGLPILRKLAQKEIEGPSLERIAGIMNEVLQQDPALKLVKEEIQAFTVDNAYMRVVNDYVFREFTSDKVFDRIKDSIANYYFYRFTAYSFLLIACLAAIGGIINLLFYLSEGYLLFEPIFIDTPLWAMAMIWFALIAVSYCLYHYFTLLSTRHMQRVINLNMLVINQNCNEIKRLTALLSKDENLKRIAKSSLKVP